MPDHQFVLTLSCPDRPGIVSAVSTFLAHNGQNILDAQQFNDVETGHFFMRVVFNAADILYRWRTGELEMIPTAIVSNHPRETYGSLDFGEIPFHCLPVTKETKREQETAVWDLVGQTKTDL